MLNRLKIELRHKQLFENQDPTRPIVVQCNVDGSAEYVTGVVPSPNWIEFTEYVENLEEFKASWKASTAGEGGEGSTSTNEGGSNYSKGVSSELRFQGEAFNFIWSWLMETPCQMLNCVEAKVTDLDCAKAFRVFEIKLENTKYSPDEPCIVEMRLREKDDVWHVFQKTTIEDNWQNWFNKDGTSTKSHPSFLFVVEKKPKFFLTILVVLAYVTGILSAGILIATTDGKRWIRKLLGICYFCPSPYIRTYIENVCNKYGFTFDTMFDDVPGNVYKDVCMFYPVEQANNEFDNYTHLDTSFIWQNRTGLPFAKYLDQLKKVFNAEWYVTPNNKLIFKPKSFFNSQPELYDFTIPGNFELNNLVYTFNGKKKAAYGSYNYTLDQGDQCCNEIKWRYNAIVDFDGKAENPMLEGNVTKQVEFAMTAFNRDGTIEPYFESSIEVGRIIAVVAVVVGLTQLFVSTGGLTVAIAAALILTGYLVTNNFVADFKDRPELEGVVRVSNNTVNQPRLLLHDTSTPFEAAKVVSVQNPAVNPFYNVTGVDYYQEHPTHDDPGLFGSSIMNVYNYPMYFEELFTGNLYDRFHETDNPLHSEDINQTWTAEVSLCCEMLDVLGVWENDFAKIGSVVILEKRPTPGGIRIIRGRIETFEPNYKDGLISLTGRVLKN